jgi:hypothetical protein
MFGIERLRQVRRAVAVNPLRRENERLRGYARQLEERNMQLTSKLADLEFKGRMLDAELASAAQAIRLWHMWRNAVHFLNRLLVVAVHMHGFTLEQAADFTIPGEPYGFTLRYFIREAKQQPAMFVRVETDGVKYAYLKATNGLNTTTFYREERMTLRELNADMEGNLLRFVHQARNGRNATPRAVDDTH